MKIKLKKKIFNFLQYYSWVCLVIFILSFTSWYLILNAIDSVKQYEKIQIFSSCYGLKNKKFSDELREYLKDDKVLEIDTYTYNPYDSNISKYYDKFGYSSDLVILREQDLLDMKETVSINYLPIDDEYLKYITSNNLDYFAYESKNYGIEIYNHSKDELEFENLFEFKVENKTDNYYLMINNSSINIGKYSQYSQTDNALKTLEYLFDIYGEK